MSNAKINNYNAYKNDMYNIIYIIIKNENINFEIIDVIIALLHLFI